MENILAIDLEDWHQIVCRNITGNYSSISHRLLAQMECLLAMLSKFDAKATFFTVGMLAAEKPELIRQIAAQGHEIACHGYSHTPIKRLSPQEFMEDTRKGKEILQNLLGQPVFGFRAPEFSIAKETLWALEILAELGFHYDSSIFPIYHRRYGISDFSRTINLYNLGKGLKIIELPLTTFRWAGVNWPVAGGGYFRLIPATLINWFIGKLNEEEINLITYFHPYDFDTKPLNSFEYFLPKNIRGLTQGLRYNLHQNLGRKSVKGKLEMLLEQFNFTSCWDFLHSFIPDEVDL